MRAPTALRPALASGLALGLAAALAAAANPGTVIDYGQYKVYQRSRALGTETFEFLSAGDSVKIVSHVVQTLPGPNGDLPIDKQAWITDEVGEENANQLFLRAARFGSFAWLFGLGVTLLIGANNVAIPIRSGAIGIMLTGIMLAFIMPETGFNPTPKENRNTWQHMWHIFKEGLGAVRSQPRLVNIVFIGLFYGLYSEGFDRLRVKHLVETFELPILFGTNQVAFFVMLEVIATLISIFAIRFVEKRIHVGNPTAIGRAILFVTSSIIIAMLSFALSPILGLSVVSMLAVDVMRGISGPLQSTWINQKLDSRVRATIHSMFGQVDAIGQMTSGPTIGLIANALSVKLAIAISALLLTPALFFTKRANSHSVNHIEVEPAPAD